MVLEMVLVGKVTANQYNVIQKKSNISNLLVMVFPQTQSYHSQRVTECEVYENML